MKDNNLAVNGQVVWKSPSQNLSEDINKQLGRYKERGMLDTNELSDGYHTIGELYQQRNELFIALCKLLVEAPNKWNEDKYPLPWKTRTHSDGTKLDGWFLLGLYKEDGKQITYHLPLNYWVQCSFAQTLEVAPKFDGHTSQDVLERLKSI